MDAVQDAVRRIAAYGLPGAPSLVEIADAAVADWDRFVGAVREQRLWGLLAEAVTRGELPGVPDATGLARRLAFEALSHTLPLESLLESTVAAMESAGVPVRVLKGASLAYLDYSDPGLRSYIDIDLLVPPAQFDRAAAVLVRAGHGRRGLPQRRPGYDRRFAKDVTFITHSGHGIDLHRTLTFGPFGLGLPIDQLWVPGQSFRVGDRTYQALPVHVRFLSVCVHAALGGVPTRLIPLRDVAQMALSTRVDEDEVRRLAREWRLEVVLARALVLVEDVLGVRLGALGEWARGRGEEPWEARALALYTDNHGPGVERARETWKHVPGLVDKVGYVRAQVFPSRTYLAGRYNGYAAYWLSHLRRGA